jgi:ribosomal protein L12E/L44/L45/RPP1/RPP2
MTDTNDNGDLDKLIERVKKLLAMAEHAGSNEHEAASAAEKGHGAAGRAQHDDGGCEEARQGG